MLFQWGSEVEIKYTMDYDDALLFKGILVDTKNVIIKEFKEYGI